MHYESDYIMRMLNLIRMLIEYLAGATNVRQLHEAHSRIEKLLARLTGLRWKEVDSLSAGQLTQMLGEQGEGPGRGFALAQLLCLRADTQERLDFAPEEDVWRRKALSLCLHISPPADLADALFVLARSLGRRFFSVLEEEEYRLLGQLFIRAGYYADAEDALCAQSDPYVTADFYRRLLRRPDEELLRGGLPREEVLQGLERIQRQYGDA